jgi:RecA/RadA recombinase
MIDPSGSISSNAKVHSEWGHPQGRLMEMNGRESSSKASLGLSILAEAKPKTVLNCRCTALARSSTALKMPRCISPHERVFRDRISTGVMTLDYILSGGIPQGRIVEIYGPESSGKTSLGLSILAEAQKKGLSVALIDAEHAWDPKHAANLGLDLSSDSFVIATPDTGEDAFAARLPQGIFLGIIYIIYNLYFLGIIRDLLF